MHNNNFDPTKFIGEVLTLVFWHEPEEDSQGRSRGVRFEGYAETQDYYHHDLRNHTVIRIPSGFDREGAVVVYDVLRQGQ